MKNIAVLSLVLLAGCGKGYIKAENTAPAIEIILDRHDAYVKADPALDAAHRASELRTSEMVRQVYREALKETQPDDGFQTNDAAPPASGPCNWKAGQPCGCNPEQGTCAMPCDGCCPHGCWPARAR